MGIGERGFVYGVNANITKDTLDFILSAAQTKCGGPGPYFQHREVETVGTEVKIHSVYTV